MTASNPAARLIRVGAEPWAGDTLTIYSLEDEVCTIGRSPLCQLRVPHLIVSRLHARVERHGSHYFLTDTGSANGTFVNGRRVQGPHRLLEGDVIGLGSASPILRFEG